MARRTTTTTTRTARTTRTNEPADDAAPVVVTEGGLGLADGMIFVSTILLVVAILMLDYHMGKHLGTGMFFK
jgi:hypothetical protein